MSSSGTNKREGGHSNAFVDEVPKDYECPICLLVLRDPGLTECCGYNFCQSCISQVQLSRGPCPRCKAARVRTVKNRQLRSAIDSLKVRCQYADEDRGCAWTGTLDCLEGHLNEGQEEGSCQYTKLTCQLGCGLLVKRGLLGLHKTILCCKRPHKCEHCDTSKPYDEILKHYRACTKYPVDCPKGCGATIERRHTDMHRNDCPLEEVRCEFHFAGCSTVFKRQDLQSHMDESSQKHMSLLAKEAVEQQRSHVRLKRKNREMEHELEKLRKKMEDVRDDMDEMQREVDGQYQLCSKLEDEVQELKRTCRDSEDLDWM